MARRLILDFGEADRGEMTVIADGRKLKSVTWIGLEWTKGDSAPVVTIESSDPYESQYIDSITAADDTFVHGDVEIREGALSTGNEGIITNGEVPDPGPEGP